MAQVLRRVALTGVDKDFLPIADTGGLGITDASLTDQTYFAAAEGASGGWANSGTSPLRQQGKSVYFRFYGKALTARTLAAGAEEMVCVLPAAIGKPTNDAPGSKYPYAGNAFSVDASLMFYMRSSGLAVKNVSAASVTIPAGATWEVGVSYITV